MSIHYDIEYNTYPYEHAIMDGAITQKASEILYGYGTNIPEDSISFFVNGEEQDNMRMARNSQGIDGLHPEYHNHVGWAMDKLCRLFEDYDPEYREWWFSLTETNRNFGNFLHPHTDDPRQLEERDPGMPTATLKCLLYLAEPRIKYKNYGTNIYLSQDRSSFVKEIEFVQCRLFMWKTGPTSWHGTNFTSGLPHRRMFYTGEYMLKERNNG